MGPGSLWHRAGVMLPMAASAVGKQGWDVSGLVPERLSEGRPSQSLDPKHLGSCACPQCTTAFWPWLFCLSVLLACLRFHPCPKFPFGSSAFADDHSEMLQWVREGLHKLGAAVAAFCTSWRPLTTCSVLVANR